MKLKSLILLIMIVLLNCFTGYCQKIKHTDYFTGNEQYADTIIEVNIKDIRKANQKFIERKYYINIAKEQEEIIKLNNEYINAQDTIIKDLQNRIIKVNELNNTLKKDYEKQRKKTTILGGICGGLAVCTITGILVAVLKK